MTQLGEDLKRRGPVETFSWPGIQLMGDGVQLALRIARQIRPLGQVLAQQAMGVLIGPALPGAMWIGEEDLNREPVRQALMLGHLFTPIIGQRFAQRGRHVRELPGEPVSGALRIRPLEAGQKDQARRPLDETADGRAVSSPLNEIAFPVARDGAARHFRGTRGNGRHVRDLAASVRPPRAGPTRLARLTQRGQQFLAQGTPRQHVQGHIDRFRREAFPHVVRVLASEASSNLFGRAPLGQAGADIPPQPRVQELARPPRLMRPGRRQGLRGAGPIRLAPRVARVFPAHGAGRAPQHRGHRPQRMAEGQSQTQGLTFFDAHVRVALVHGNTLADHGLKCCTWS
jgi:hypothetical protein